MLNTAKSRLGIKYGLKPSLPDIRHDHLEDHPGLVTPHPVIGPPVSCGFLKQFLPPKINQLQVGMCTGCGSSRALKTRLNALQYKWPFTPSALDIYAKARKAEGTALTDDSGAAIVDVMSVINSEGVAPEDSNILWSWPFSASDNRWQEQPPPACETDALKHKLVKYMKVSNTTQDIKTALLNGFPVVIGIVVYPSFEGDDVAKTGMVPMPTLADKIEGPLGGHCLFLYGYGEKDPNYADGVNSWGESWGDGGNFHIPFDYLIDQNLTSDLWAIEVVS